MFTLRDSHIDSALVVMVPLTMPMCIDNPPYGNTFFGHPSGSYSDGRVINTMPGVPEVIGGVRELGPSALHGGHFFELRITPSPQPQLN
jgi:hypothetical protein